MTGLAKEKRYDYVSQVGARGGRVQVFYRKMAGDQRWRRTVTVDGRRVGRLRAWLWVWRLRLTDSGGWSGKSYGISDEWLRLTEGRKRWHIDELVPPGAAEGWRPPSYGDTMPAPLSRDEWDKSDRWYAFTLRGWGDSSIDLGGVCKVWYRTSLGGPWSQPIKTDVLDANIVPPLADVVIHRPATEAAA